MGVSTDVQGKVRIFEKSVLDCIDDGTSRPRVTCGRRGGSPSNQICNNIAVEYIICYLFLYQNPSNSVSTPVARAVDSYKWKSCLVATDQALITGLKVTTAKDPWAENPLP